MEKMFILRVLWVARITVVNLLLNNIKTYYKFTYKMNVLVRHLNFICNRRMFHTSKIIKSNILYTKSHETIQIEDDEVKIGISDYARKEMGEIVFIENEVENEENVETGDVITTIESVKASSELFSPSDGIITEQNVVLIDNIENMHESEIWFIKYKPSNPSEILENMNKEEYLDYLKKI